MFLANVNGRATAFVDGEPIDVEQTSEGKFPADVVALYEQWAEFRAWADGIGVRGAGHLDLTAVSAPSPSPSQVFAISLNYRDHAEEADLDIPDVPAAFTKWPSCIVGPGVPVELSGDTTDWEVELVAVIGRTAHNVSYAEAWDYVAGVTIGQDISDRARQLSGPLPQFSLGKSYSGYGPTGPWLVTPDELPDRNDLSIACTLDGEVVQTSRTSQLIFDVPRLVEYISSIVTLRPGDLIFTGTPSGVGFAREPKRFLSPGQEILSEIEGIGRLVTIIGDTRAF